METNMKRATSKILIIALALISVSQPQLKTGAQAKPDMSTAYTLGVYLGFASFQLQASEQAIYDADRALNNARVDAEFLKPIIPQLNLDKLEIYSQRVGD